MVKLSNASVPAAVVLKIRSLIDTLRFVDTVEKRTGLINLVLLDQETPSLDAARTIAIKDSNQMDSVKKEYSKPSFDTGEEYVFTDKRKPSKFTTHYNVTDEYIDMTNYSRNIENMDVQDEMQIIEVHLKNELLAKFVLPLEGGTGPIS